MRGILLAGGKGTRLWPLTVATNKHMLAVYDKPMIYYSLSTLMLAGIREILIVADAESIDSYKELLGAGSQLGISIQYAIQARPEGIPQSLIIGQDFLEDHDPLLVLGDNVMYGPQVGRNLRNYVGTSEPHILTKTVDDPSSFGVATYSKEGEVLRLEEKPTESNSSEAIVGVYFLTNESCEIAKTLSKSARNEFEIIDILNIYQSRGALNAHRLPKGTVWLDTGTVENLALASDYVRVVQARQGELICSPEQIAFENEWIDSNHLKKLMESMPRNTYSSQLSKLIRL
jgi:glucose-1-phosphate thymidylyltransferase